MSIPSANTSKTGKLEWRYLLTLCLPLFCFIGLHFRGWWSPGSLYFGFLLVPVLERYFFQGKRWKPDPQPPSWFSRGLLYFNVPLLLFLTYYYYEMLTTVNLHGAEWFFLSLNLGIVYGSNGINVAHELGHRHRSLDRWLAFVLLLPSYYVHFTMAHNLGHHVRVGRPDDPASAGRGMGFYAFLFQVITGEWNDVIQIERRRLQRKGRSMISLHNRLIGYLLADIAWGLLIYVLWGGIALLSSLFVAFVGVTLLALINYIEHYGLKRRKTGRRYERVAPHHSWDSTHFLGRTLLFQLPLHADE